MNVDYHFRSRRSNVMATHGMVASSQPLATLAGLDMLREGGTAADAAVAVAVALSVVEPFSTGIGGDCFALYWDNRQKKVFALNGSGPAAQNANIEDILRLGYSEMPLFTGHAVSVPGTVAGWTALLTRFGKLPLAEVLVPAIQYALEGYPVTEWVGAGWKLMEGRLLRETVDESLPLHLRRSGPPQPSGHEFLIDGRAPAVGEVIQLRTLGETLQRIAAEGRDAVYTGKFPQQVCEHVRRYGGWLTPEDMTGFEAEWVEPITADYRGVRLYECPPNGQGLAAIMAARIAEGFDLAEMDPVERTHTLIECMRLGFTEALLWVADPHFSPAPLEQLLSPAYIRSRREMIRPDAVISHLETGLRSPGGDTVYLSVVDGEGNACSFINSLFMGGGTGLVVPGTGVFLQNRGALFSLDPTHPNALAGGKRPYHTIIPGMLTKDGELFASFGIMGGFMQPQAHLQVLSNLVDLDINPQQALDMPRFRLNAEDGKGVGADDPGGEVFMEEGFDAETMAALQKKGHKITFQGGRQRAQFGGGQVIRREPASGVLIAGSDPRKDGCAMGF
jgi:gamma-glutamyltranspeptidase/glutathione hydrolase